jgi:hypothetical protein
MIAHAVRTDSISVLRKVRAVLMTVFLVTMCAGCAQNAPTAATAVPSERMTIVMTKDLNITRVVNANGTLIPIRDNITANQAQLTERERPYLFGRAMMANPGNPSVTVPAKCVWKEQDPTPPACWPADQSVFIDFDGGRILNVSYQSYDDKLIPAGRLVGAAPVPLPGTALYGCCCVVNGVWKCFC